MAGVRDFVARVDLEGRFILTNREPLTFRAAQPLAHTLFDMFETSGHAALRASLEHAREAAESSVEHVVGRGSLGPYSPYRVRVTPVHAEGKIAGFTIVASEVTSTRHTQQAIEESEAKLRVAAHALGMGLFSIDVQHDRASWDPTMYAILGQARDPRPETLAAYLRAVHPDDRSAVARALDRIIEFGEFDDLEHRVIRHDGEVRWVLCKGAVVRDAEQRVVKLVGGVLDITDRREFEARMRHAQKMDAVGQLSAGVAHNFNNMLTGVISSVELALQDATPRSRALLESTRDAAERAAAMVRQLLVVAGNRGRTEQALSDVSAVVERTVEFFRATLDRRVLLTFEAAPHVARIFVDAAQLEQSVLNVLINARDALESVHDRVPFIRVDVSVAHSDAPELLRFGRIAQGTYVVIRIEDNGAGMSAETKARIFEPFYTTKQPGRGTGLGLAMVYGVLREHAGFVESESEHGRGTTFWLGLPVAQGHAERGRNSSSEDAHVA
jgi:PAS domain S-box-containing protein